MNLLTNPRVFGNNIIYSFPSDIEEDVIVICRKLGGSVAHLFWRGTTKIYLFDPFYVFL